MDGTGQNPSRIDIMNKKILIGSVFAVVILVLASFPSVVGIQLSFQLVEKGDLIFNSNIPLEEYYTLNVTVIGYGDVIKNPDWALYPNGTIVELTAVPGLCWYFDHWEGDLISSTNPDTITMDGNKEVTVWFVESPIGLTIIVVGNGSVQVTPDQPTYPCGTTVELEAFPDPGWTFDHWDGDLTGSTNPDTIIMWGPSTVYCYFIEEEPEIDPDQSYVTLTGGIGMHPSLQSQYAEWYPFTVTVIDTGGQPIEGIPAENFSFTAALGTNTFSHCDLNSNMEWDPIDMQTDVNGEIQFRVRCTTSVTRDNLDPTPNGGYIDITATVQSVTINDIDSLPVSSCDIDGDGNVDLSDFAKFAVDFGLNRQRSDYDFDFGVDLSDFSKFAIEYGYRQTC